METSPGAFSDAGAPPITARPAAAAGALFVDGDGAVLLVEPTYQPRWEIPGGGVERGETPREACARELQDELGLDVAIGRLLVVDWAPHRIDQRTGEDRIRFVFDGGTLTDAQLDAITLASGELASWAFVPPEELFVMVVPALARRLGAALDTRARGTMAYLEHGLAP